MATTLLEQWQPLLVAVICVLVILLFLQLMYGVTISSKGLNATASKSGMDGQGPTGNFGDGNYLRLKSERDDAGGAIAYLPQSVNPKDLFAGSNGRNEPPSFWNPGDMTYQQAAGLTLDGMQTAPWAAGGKTTLYSGLYNPVAMVREGLDNPDNLNGQKLNPY